MKCNIKEVNMPSVEAPQLDTEPSDLDSFLVHIEDRTDALLRGALQDEAISIDERLITGALEARGNAVAYDPTSVFSLTDMDPDDLADEDKAILRSIWQQQALEEFHRYNESHDALTGVLNRHGLAKELDSLVAEAQNNEDSYVGREGLSVIFIDGDGFGNVNKIFGHEVGDKLLQVIAEVLSRNIRGIIDPVEDQRDAEENSGITYHERRITDEKDLALQKATIPDYIARIADPALERDKDLGRQGGDEFVIAAAGSVEAMEAIVDKVSNITVDIMTSGGNLMFVVTERAKDGALTTSELIIDGIDSEAAEELKYAVTLSAAGVHSSDQDVESGDQMMAKADALMATQKRISKMNRKLVEVYGWNGVDLEFDEPIAA